MIKSIIVVAAAMLSIGLSSCTSDNGFVLGFNQNSIFSTKTMAMVATSEILEKYPDSVADYKKIANVFRSLVENEPISKADIAADIEKAIIKSNSSHKLMMLLSVNAIIDSVFTTDQIDVSAHKQLFLDIANGIEAAIRMYELIVVDPAK